MKYTKDEDDNYTCNGCGWHGSRSGYYKHAKKCDADSKAGVDDSGSVPPTSDTHVSPPPPTPVSEDEGHIPVEDENKNEGWTTFGSDLVEQEEATDYLPTPLTIAAKQAKKLRGKVGKKLTTKEKKMLEETNIALVKQVAGAVDFGLTKYGQAIRMDEEFVVRHSEQDKNLVARATWAWLDENELYPSMHIGTGAVATALWGYYIVPPVLKARKGAKKKLVKGLGARFLSKIPVFGKRWRKPKTVDIVPELDE